MAYSARTGSNHASALAFVLSSLLGFSCSSKSATPTAPTPVVAAPVVPLCTFEVTGGSVTLNAFNQSPQIIGVRKSAPSCAWSAATAASFIKILSVTDTTVTYSLTPNAGPERTGVITVAGKDVEIRQGEGPPINIAGTVSNAAGFRLLFVTVEVVGANPPIQTLTDNLGGYRLNGIRTTPFTLRLTHRSYKTTTADYELAPGTGRQDANHALEPLTTMAARSIAVLDASHSDADLPFTSPGATPATWVKAAWGLYPVPFDGSFWPHTQISACFKKAGAILRHTCDAKVIQCAFNAEARDCSVMPDQQEFRPRVEDWMGISDVDGVIVLVSNQFAVDRNQDRFLSERAVGVQNAAERALRIRYSR